MSDVLVVMKILPEDVEVDMEELEEAVVEALEALEIVKSVEGTETEPIAFGLEALKVAVVVPDAEGGTDELEKVLKELEQVGEVEVESASRML